jgi:osmotically-inducible protein OsmY
MLLVVDTGDLGARSHVEKGNEAFAPLKESVLRRLEWDREPAPFQLEVRVNGAVVKLIGTVSTTAESQRAERIAHDITGVLAVVNELTVDPARNSSGETLLARPNDASLEKRISEVLEGDARLAVESIQVNVDNGHVALRGRVPSIAHQVRAGRIIDSLFGVQSVDNSIKIQSLRRPKRRR